MAKNVEKTKTMTIVSAKANGHGKCKGKTCDDKSKD